MRYAPPAVFHSGGKRAWARSARAIVRCAASMTPVPLWIRSQILLDAMPKRGAGSGLAILRGMDTADIAERALTGSHTKEQMVTYRVAFRSTTPAIDVSA